MDAQLTELNARLADVQKELVEMTAQKNRAQAEIADVTRRLADSESQAAQLSRLRVALAQQVFNTAKSAAEYHHDIRHCQWITVMWSETVGLRTRPV